MTHKGFFGTEMAHAGIKLAQKPSKMPKNDSTAVMFLCQPFALGNQQAPPV